ncbi:MAG: ABC transporter permease [Spirochaetaceae bacterium]|jgi:ABC-type polysaccharide/polyol phosphate export permease|nr:ABC transporter permease [Spirochaetaceae bacterium]
MEQFVSILWREWILFKNKFVDISLSALIGPLLYLVAFGWGLGGAFMASGVRYTAFVTPGIIAMNGMTQGFGVIANDINMARIYQKTFETVMISPISMPVFTIARITANMLRCLYSAALIIAASFLFNAGLDLDWYFFLLLILNCAVFSSIGFIAGLCVDSHADMAKMSNFIVTPMSFLCGTFFPLDRFPLLLRKIIEFLPLTQTVSGMRSGVNAALSFIPPLALLIWLVFLIPVAIILCKKAE